MQTHVVATAVDVDHIEDADESQHEHNVTSRLDSGRDSARSSDTDSQASIVQNDRETSVSTCDQV